MRIFNSIISAFFPNTCIACGEIIDDGESLCDYCYEMLDKVDFTKTCKRCGLTIKNCECKYRVFYFSGVAAPFYNSASAKEIMYKFKFSKATKNAEFISQQMLLAIEMVYNDINFDAVTFVPLTFKRFLNRGFNQSKILAEKISEKLNLPVLDILYRNKSKTDQHDIKNPKERFKNVEGLYGTKGKVNGKNILLVDDIKTTGATLNECAKQLILSGADNVYCVTGLISDRRKEK